MNKALKKVLLVGLAVCYCLYMADVDAFIRSIFGKDEIVFRGFTGFLAFGLWCKWVTQDIVNTPGWNLLVRGVWSADQLRDADEKNK